MPEPRCGAGLIRSAPLRLRRCRRARRAAVAAAGRGWRRTRRAERPRRARDPGKRHAGRGRRHGRSLHGRGSDRGQGASASFATAPAARATAPGARRSTRSRATGRTSAYMGARTDDQLYEVIYNGKGSMPAWGKTGILTETQIRSAIMKVAHQLVVRHPRPRRRAGPRPTRARAGRAGAQLVEHLICNEAVGGSSPFASSPPGAPNPSSSRCPTGSGHRFRWRLA